MLISRTPYRISFFGGGSDYPVWYREEPGAVLSTSIDKYCYLSCRPLPPYFPHRFRVVYSNIESVGSVDEIEHVAVRNVLRFLGVETGLEIHHHGDAPARAGLGSSSSFTVGLLNAVYGLLGERPGRMRLAQEAIYVEQELNRENVGSQDQMAAALGGFNRIDFHPDGKIVATRAIAMPDRLDALEDHLMLFFTGLNRHASEVAAEQIRNTRQRKLELREMVQLVEEACTVLSGSGPITEIGRLLHSSWTLKQKLSSRISTPLVDELYQTALAAGAVGGKLLGAGGGGFLLLFAEPGVQPAVSAALSGYLQIPFRFEDEGSHIIFHRPDEYERQMKLETGVSPGRARLRSARASLEVPS